MHHGNQMILGKGEILHIRCTGTGTAGKGKLTATVTEHGVQIVLLAFRHI